MDNSEFLKGREYVGISNIDGPLVVVKNTHSVGYKELVEVIDKFGNIRQGLVLDTSKEAVVVQVFEGTTGLNMHL